MRRFKILLAVTLLHVLPHPVVAADRDADAIRQVHHEWVDAINAGDYASPGAMALWSKELRGWAPGMAEDSYDREAAGLPLHREVPARCRVSPDQG